MNDQNFNTNDQNFNAQPPENYQQPSPFLPPPQDSGKGFSIAALVLGILSCILAWFYVANIFGLIFGILGVALGAVGRSKARVANAPMGMGTAGLVVSIVGLSLSFVGFLTCTLCVWCVGESISSALSV